MVFTSCLRRRLCALALLVGQSPTSLALQTGRNESSQYHVRTQNVTAHARPLYTIAHRVLTVQGVKDALSHGANALEIDARPWPSGWLADHDGSPTSAGDTIEIMFETIAEERRKGHNMIFVWLDIKTPDLCDPSDSMRRHCSIVGLRELARHILEPAQVQVLYGFSWAYYTAYDVILNDINANEAITLNGRALYINNLFESRGPSDVGKRVMSYGYNELQIEFGDCYEPDYYTCTELRQATQAKVFGLVFGWTLSADQKQYADLMLDDADVDGIIYGFKWTYYYDDPRTRSPVQDIKSWINKHPERRYLATVKDKPW